MLTSPYEKKTPVNNLSQLFDSRQPLSCVNPSIAIIATKESETYMFSGAKIHITGDITKPNRIPLQRAHKGNCLPWKKKERLGN